MRSALAKMACLGMLAPAVVWAAPPPTPLVVKAARLIDGKTDRVLSPAMVVVENGRIVQVGTAVAIPAGARVIDLGNATLLPGLIDAHDHLTTVPENSGYRGLGISLPRETLYGATNALKTLRAGFTNA